MIQRNAFLKGWIALILTVAFLAGLTLFFCAAAHGGRPVPQRVTGK